MEKEVAEAIDKLSEKLEGRATWQKIVSTVLAVVSACITAIAARQTSLSSDAKQALEESKTKLEQRMADVNAAQGEVTVAMALVHEAMQAVQDRSPERQQLVTKMLGVVGAAYSMEGEREKRLSAFAYELASLVGDSGGAGDKGKEVGAYFHDEAVAVARPEVKAAAPLPAAPEPVQNKSASAASPVISEANGTLVARGAENGWDYDVFWCEQGSARNRALGEAVFNALHERQASSGLGRIRLRKLPEAVNQMQGYGLRSEVAVRRSPDKAAKADELAGWAREALSKQPNVTVQTVESSSRLPYYLSVFVCL